MPRPNLLRRMPKPPAFTQDDVVVWSGGGTFLENLSKVYPPKYRQWQLYHQQDRHDALVDWMISTGRVYYKPGKPKVVHNNGADVMIYAQDLHPKYHDYLELKINNSLNFHGAVSNYGVLNALRSLNSNAIENNEASGHIYASGGALMYLAEIAAIFGNGKDFFETCEKNGFSLKKDEPFNKAELVAALEKTFHDLGIENAGDIPNFTKTWTEEGFYTVKGIEQKEANGCNCGSYTMLAGNILAYNTKYPGFNNLISYIQARSSVIGGRKESDLAEVLPSEVGTVSLYMCNNRDILGQYINYGKAVRKGEILDSCKQSFEKKDIKPLSIIGKAYFKKLFKTMHFQSLGLLAFSDHSIAYAAGEGDVRNIVPGEEGEGYLGSTGDECDISRGSAGFRIVNPKMILLSDGYVGLTMEAEDLLIKHVMTLIHEAIHVALDDDFIVKNIVRISGGKMAHEGHISDSMIADLEDALLEVCKKLHAMSAEDRRVYLERDCLLDKPLKIADIFNEEMPETYFYDIINWREELFANWAAISLRGGEYMEDAKEYSIFHGEDDEDTPEAVVQSRMASRAVYNIVNDLFETMLLGCRYAGTHQIPGVTMEENAKSNSVC